MPLMVRSAKIMAGRSSRTRESAVCPSATIWQSLPCRCRTRAMSRATCGSSSTIRITFVLLEPDADALAGVAQNGAGRTAAAVPERVVPPRHARRQPVLPLDQRQRKCHAHDEGERVSRDTARLSAIEGQEGHRAPRSEEHTSEL